MIHPERLTFGQIANLWSQEPQTYPFHHLLKKSLAQGNHGDATRIVLQELVSAVWRGDFERSGKSQLTIPFAPGVQAIHGQLVDVVEIGRRPKRRRKNPVKHPAEKEKRKYLRPPVYGPSVSLPHIEFTREDLREGLQQSNWCPPYLAKADDDFLANRPLDFYPPEFRETCLERLSITRTDFKQWCKIHDLSLPIFSRSASAKGRGRKPGSGSYFKADKPLLVEMWRRKENGNAASTWDAALSVADQATGEGGPLSKAKRLSDRYKKHEDEISSWPEFHSN